MRLTRRAARDLHGAWSFVAETNKSAADRLLADIERAVEHLAEFPESGRNRLDDLGRPLRSFAVRGYIIFYRRSGASIEIIRVLHGSRDIGSILGL